MPVLDAICIGIGLANLACYVAANHNTNTHDDEIKEVLAPQQETALPFNKKVSFRYRLFDLVAH